MDNSIEGLGIYQTAIELVGALDFVIETAKGKGANARLLDLSRAALAVPVNVVEASARATRGERHRYWRQARIAAIRCLTLLDALGQRGVVSACTYSPLRRDLANLARRLTELIAKDRVV